MRVKMTSSLIQTKCLMLISLLICLGQSVVPTTKHSSSTDSVSYDAIRQLHHQIDDNNDGDIDISESSGFLNEDLQISEKERLNRRQNQFHKDDTRISVDELWQKWSMSEEYKWTTKQVVEWLKTTVELPQYAELFEKAKVSGKDLVKMANPNNQSYMTNVLHITNPVHRHKIQLRAIDVVLFGHRIATTHWKDLTITAMAMTVIILFVAYRYQKIKSGKELLELQSRVNELRTLQDDWHSDDKLKDDQSTHSEDDDRKNVEISRLRAQLEDMSRALLDQNNSRMGMAPLALQPLLRKSKSVELAYLKRESDKCIEDLRILLETVEKLKVRQSNPLQSFKLAFGTSTDAEVLDKRISKCKQTMTKARKEKEEAQQRWQQIEMICGFSNVSSPQSVPPIYQNADSQNPSVFIRHQQSVPALAKYAREVQKRLSFFMGQNNYQPSHDNNSETVTNARRASTTKRQLFSPIHVSNEVLPSTLLPYSNSMTNYIDNNANYKRNVNSQKASAAMRISRTMHTMPTANEPPPMSQKTLPIGASYNSIKPSFDLSRNNSSDCLKQTGRQKQAHSTMFAADLEYHH